MCKPQIMSEELSVMTRRGNIFASKNRMTPDRPWLYCLSSEGDSELYIQEADIDDLLTAIDELRKYGIKKGEA